MLRKTMTSAELRRRPRPTALALGLALSLAGSAALAQSNASGVIFGHAEPGTTVQVQNVDTGQTRTIAPGTDGSYRASALPIGRYRVVLQRDGQVLASRDNVRVAVNTGTDVSFAAAGAANAQNLGVISVTANALPAIDVSAVDSRTVLTAEELRKVPVQRSVAAAALLAPGTVAADARYGGTVSFGGASAAENQYYLNGFPVTNALTGMGFTELPFDAIDQQQVITGGYGAEYGRATGGVVNIVSKSGSNAWKMGAQVQWSPRALAASPRDIYYPHNGNGNDGELFQNRSGNKAWTDDYGVYLSGPLVKDRLFLYATAERSETRFRTVNSVLAGTAADADSKTTRWLGKVNWNITDNHTLEFTGMGDTTRIDRTIYAYDYETLTQGRQLGTESLKNFDLLGVGATPGGNVYIGKYTGYLTDDLTVTALYGKTRSDHSDVPLGAGDTMCPVVADARGEPDTITGCAVSAGGTVLPDGARDDTKGWRLDIEYQLGDHDLRAGVDNLDLQSYSGTVPEGGESWRYARTEDVNLTAFTNVDLSSDPQFIVRQRIINFNANVEVKQKAQYLEDHWQISDRWLAYLGLRNEQFSNLNGAGEVYVKQRHQLAPRLGISWDVFGDSTFKIYANAGRYHLAIPSNVAIRGASASLFRDRWFTYTGFDPATGVPTGLTPVSDPRFVNGEDGVTTPDPRTVAAKGLSAYYQDEYILGFDKALGSDWAVGAKATYRKLLSAIDDFCDNAPFQHYADRNGLDISNARISGCYLFNPGKNNTFAVDMGDGSFRDFKLTKEDFAGNPNGIGFPDLKRKYLAVDLYVAHQFADRWYGKLDYVWSKNYGNSEGMLKSDIAQTDPSVTQDWDFPELMIGSSGYLPNDRRHQLKAYGYFQMTPEWLFGANMVIASGRPKNCLGNPTPADYDRQGYGNSFFFCDLDHDGSAEFTPRGSLGRLPWTYRLDLNAQWRPAWADHKLAIEADVFNVFDQQRTTVISERNGGDPQYGRSVAFEAPRTVRLGVRYDFEL